MRGMGEEQRTRADELWPRNQHIMYQVLRDGRTLESVGAELDLTPERVRQIVRRAFRKTYRRYVPFSPEFSGRGMETMRDYVQSEPPLGYAFS